MTFWLGLLAGIAIAAASLWLGRAVGRFIRYQDTPDDTPKPPTPL